MSWQPIETAPKDGTDILVIGGPDFGENIQLVVCWDESGRDKYQWATADGPNYSTTAFSHWMPLPAPPGDNGHD